MKKIIITILFISILYFIPLPVSAATSTYTPMEAIPGFGQPENFPDYLMQIYKFGLGAIGVSAMFMIMIGGYMYLTSAGNASQTDKAKGVIYDAIAGLILALTSYILLYTINPDLVKFQLITSPEGSTSNAPKTCSLPTTPGTGTKSMNQYYNEACPNPQSTSPIVFSGSSTESPNGKCAELIPNDISGIKKELLRTIAQIETSCGADKKSLAGACGLMQLLPETASRLNGSSVTCDQLIADDELSIKLAVQYINNNQSAHGGNIDKILAGYNSGYATSGSGGLAPSVDCPGSLKFQCCKNPQELDETIGYVWKGVGLMKKQ